MSNFQKIGLKRLLNHEEFYDKLGINHFSHKTSKYIYRTIVSYYGAYFKIPTMDILVSSITNNLPEDKAEMYVSYLQSINKIDIDDITEEEILDGLEGDLLTRTIDNNVEELTEAAYNKDIDKMRELLDGIIPPNYQNIND